MVPEDKNRSVRMETRLSIGLLAILLLTGAGIYLRQFDFNPAVLALRPESHEKVFLQSPSQEAMIDTAGTGISPFSPQERFHADNLYEKINGRADLYLASGFSSLRTQRFTVPEGADQWVEVFVYEMSSSENAFSVFSTQRRSDDKSETSLPNAYHTENALFMVIGNFYVEIIGTDASDAGKQARKRLSSKIMEKFGGRLETALPDARLFPPEGFVETSLQIIATNAFGHENLDRVFTGEYLVGADRLTAFVSERENTIKASTLAEAYKNALLSYGAKAVDLGAGLEDAAVIQFFDTYEIIFSRGNVFAGVHEAKDLQTAIRLANDLSAHLEKIGER